MEKQNENQYSASVLQKLAEKAVREAHRAELKQAKKLWLDSWGFTKRSWRPQMFIRIDADGVYLGKDCQPWENRIISD